MLLKNREYSAIVRSKKYFHIILVHSNIVEMYQQPNCCRSLNDPSIHQYYDIPQSCEFGPEKTVEGKRKSLYFSSSQFEINLEFKNQLPYFCCSNNQERGVHQPNDDHTKQYRGLN